MAQQQQREQHPCECASLRVALPCEIGGHNGVERIDPEHCACRPIGRNNSEQVRKLEHGEQQQNGYCRKQRGVVGGAGSILFRFLPLLVGFFVLKIGFHGLMDSAFE